MKPKLTPNLKLLVSLSIIELFALYLILPLLRGGLPPGIDTPTHLFTSWFLDKSLDAGHIPDINPYWYSGQPFLKYYPPLAYCVVSFLARILGDVTFSYKLITVLFFLLTPLTIYLVSREFGLGRKYSLLSTFIFASSYTYISNIALFGRFTTHLALPFFMLSLYFLLRLRKGGFRNAIYGGLCFGVLLLSHQLTAYSFGMVFGVFVLVEAVKSFRSKYLKPLRNMGAMALVGFVVSSWWLVPFLIHINDIGFQRNIPGGFDTPLHIFWSQLVDSDNINTGSYPLYIGYAPLFLACLGAISLLSKRKPLLVLLVALLFLASLGTSLRTFHCLPFYNNLDVARFFLCGMALLSILCGFGMAKVSEIGSSRVLIFVLTALIVVLSLVPALRARDAFGTWQVDKDLKESFQWLKQEGHPGRVHAVGLETWDSYLLPVYADRQIIDGWLHESTPHWKGMLLLDNMEFEPGPLDIEAYYGILREYDAKYVLLANRLGDHYFLRNYQSSKYEEYATLLNSSEHFEEVATFGETMIFQVLDE
jgi:uncharacterized membrane protein